MAQDYDNMGKIYGQTMPPIFQSSYSTRAMLKYEVLEDLDTEQLTLANRTLHQSHWEQNPEKIL